MRGICISEKMPSCMRAPPDAVKMMKGTRRSIAAVMPVMMASPAARPSEPPMKSKFCTATITSTPSIVPAASRIASLAEVFARFSLSRSV